MSGRTKCETCCGWYASGYARCPECATAPTPVTVAQARDAYEDAYYEWRSERKNVAASVAIELAIEADKAWSALIAAVRAECAAKVEALPGMEDDGSPGDWENYLRRGDVLAALEAQP